MQLFENLDIHSFVRISGLIGVVILIGWRVREKEVKYLQ